MHDAREAKQLVTQLRNEFQDLYDVAEIRWDIARGRHGFHTSSEGGRSIEQELINLGYPSPQPVVSREVEDAARTVVGTLSEPKYSIHIEPHADKWKEKADKLEKHDAHLMLGLNGATVRNAVHRHQAVSPFAAVVIRQRAYALPTRNKGESSEAYTDRVDRYKREFRAIEVLVEDPTGWAFLEDGNLDLSMCVGKYKKPIMDFTKDYAEYDRKGETSVEQVFELFGKQFPQLRAGYSIGDERSQWQGKAIDVCVIDDGAKITHYAELPGGDLVDIHDSWDNPFGRPTLLPIPGVFDQSATRPEDRYLPWLLPLMQSRWNMDLTLSKWESKAAERPIHTAPLDPRVHESLTGMQPEERERYLDSLSQYREDRINPTFGTVSTLDAEVNQYEAQVFENLRVEHDQYLPRSSFSGSEGSQGILRNTPTSSLLRLDELEGQKFGPVHQNWIDHGLLKLFEMHDNYWRGRDDDEKSYVVTIGKELREGKSVKRGEKLELSPSDFGFGYDRFVSQVDKRASTIARNIEVMNLRTNINGRTFITDEEIATGLGIEDATDYLVKSRAETRMKRIEQAADSLAMAASVQRNARTLGVDVTQYLLSASGAPGEQPVGSPPPGQGTGGDQGLSGMSVAPPPHDDAPVSGGMMG